MNNEYYKKIADSDPGGDFDAALAAMLLITEDSTPASLVTYRGIGADVGLAASLELETAIKASASIPEWVNISLSTDGINVNDPQVAAVLTALSLTDGVADAIKAIGLITTNSFPNLKAGHLEVAREKRLSGEV